MLDTIRSAVNSWVAKVFLGLLVLCFVLLWGVPELRRTSGHDLFISGKSTIKADTYKLALRDQTMRFSVANHLPRLLSEGEAQQYGIPQLVLAQLQQDVLLDEQARLMKIGVSKMALPAPSVLTDSSSKKDISIVIFSKAICASSIFVKVILSTILQVKKCVTRLFIHRPTA
ncbi:SurA N-terminal domain-containing protein [Bartonella apis]|uniref:SurA N-terminal domain-containing protein n=1 Tax=Bartonella apis TaxID=1686310 RepID=UPI0031407765